MKIVKENDPEALKLAAEAILSGGLVVYPTDTAYGLGANALDHHAVTNMYDLRERSHDQPTHIVVKSTETAWDYAELDEGALKLADRFWPGPLTLVLRKVAKVYNTPSGERDSVAIRIPDNSFTLSLAGATEVPITTPSANKRGGVTPYSIKDVLASFGDDADKIDIIVDGGELKKQDPSTFVDMTVDPPEVIREGPISREEILKVIG